MKNESYEEFVEKFKPKKTTDDCYTPPEVYKVIKDWVCRRYGIDPEKIIRPFWPGADYQAMEYQEGCVVVDNPPFSILSKICEYYLDRGIPFFLFAPSLTCLSGKKTVQRMSHIICDCNIVYENGAVVKTSFVTSFEPEIIAQTSPELTMLVNDAIERERRLVARELLKYEYPDYIVTTAMMQKMAKYGIEYQVEKRRSLFVRSLDAQKAMKKAIFGGGLLLSEKAAAEKAAAEKAAAEKAAAEKAAAEKAAAEKKNAIVFELSEREKALVRQLGM